jgi:anti-sigma factor RsiW
MKNQELLKHPHDRAHRLIDQERIEGLPQDEHRWLREHLAECESCASRAANTEATLQAVRSLSAGLPHGLAASTILMVREEATRIKERRRRTLGLIAGCAVSWMAGLASAPLVWRVCKWAGTELDLPRIVWQLGFLSWWLVPAAAVGLVILWASARLQIESPYDSTGMDLPRNEQ